MAGDYMFEEAIAAVPSRFEKFLKAFIIVAVLALTGELIWLVGITPFRPFARIEISGSAGLAREDLLATAGISKNSSYFSTDVRAMERALMGLSSLQSVRVFKTFPDRLQIILEGRQAVATALVSLNGRTVPVFFDSQGVIFRIGEDETEHHSFDEPLSGGSEVPENEVPGNEVPPLPVISGLIIDNPVQGMKLPAMFIPLFMELEKIESSAPELLTAISELRINPKPYEGYDLILYPVHKKVKVHILELNEDLLRYTLLMVDVIASKEPGIESLDFRSGIASYKPLEAAP